MKNVEWTNRKILLALAVSGGIALSSGCSTMKDVFAVGGAELNQKPIANPFGNFHVSEKNRYQSMILRTRKGDRAIEIELPRHGEGIKEFVVPMAPEFINKGRKIANADNVDPHYAEKRPGMTDREITRGFPQGSPELDWERNQIEKGLGLKPAANEVPDSNKSYLGALDKVKQLYRVRRFEAGLLEVDHLIRQYPTDPRLYEMRGTLLSRLGYQGLAIKSWEQALELNPANQSLRKFIEKKRRKPASKRRGRQ